MSSTRQEIDRAICTGTGFTAWGGYNAEARPEQIEVKAGDTTCTISMIGVAAGWMYGYNYSCSIGGGGTGISPLHRGWYEVVDEGRKIVHALWDQSSTEQRELLARTFRALQETDWYFFPTREACAAHAIERQIGVFDSVAVTTNSCASPKCKREAQGAAAQLRKLYTLHCGKSAPVLDSPLGSLLW
jgi:hypothetical protein